MSKKIERQPMDPPILRPLGQQEVAGALHPDRKLVKKFSNDAPTITEH